VPCHVAIAPVVPQITDHELEHIVEAAARPARAGGFYLPVRLPHEVAPLFRAWLDEHYPDRAAKVMATIRSLRGGKRQRPQFLQPDARPGPWAELLKAPGSRSRWQALRPAPGQVRAAHATCSSRPRATRCGCFDRRIANLIDRAVTASSAAASAAP
jgi:hypothetical protein